MDIFEQIEEKEKRLYELKPILGDIGYKSVIQDVQVRYLLSPKSFGVNLIYRLKDKRPLLIEEREFWAEQLFKLINNSEDIDFVTTPPDSGKVPISEHLASSLALYVSELCQRPFVRVFNKSEKTKKYRSGYQKLIEDIEFNFNLNYKGKNILLVEDVIYTRSTVSHCIDAVKGLADLNIISLYKA